MTRVLMPLLMVGLFSLGLLGCQSDDKGGPIDPNPGAGIPNPPDYGNPAPGQNDALRVVAVAVDNDKKAPFSAPLTVTIAGGIPPYEVLWDFDNDGVTDSFGEAVSITFASPGDYQATVRVKDSANVVATDSVEVHVLPPGPDLRITANGMEGVASGKAAFSVNFNTAGTQGVVTRFEWDFQGDGVIDSTSQVTGNANFVYTTPGTYTPTLRATDNEGFVEEASILVIATF